MLRLASLARTAIDRKQRRGRGKRGRATARGWNGSKGATRWCPATRARTSRQQRPARARRGHGPLHTQRRARQRRRPRRSLRSCGRLRTRTTIQTRAWREAALKLAAPPERHNCGQARLACMHGASGHGEARENVNRCGGATRRARQKRQDRAPAPAPPFPRCNHAPWLGATECPSSPAPPPSTPHRSPPPPPLLRCSLNLPGASASSAARIARGQSPSSACRSRTCATVLTFSTCPRPCASRATCSAIGSRAHCTPSSRARAADTPR